MGRVPCCEKLGVKKGPWTPEEDQQLITYIQNHGHSSWRALPKEAGLSRCGKSCRLRWTNYLRPGIKRGNFSAQEENTIIQLHAVLGNRWSTISTHLPGRTDNEIKNHWNTRLRKRMLKMGLDPMTHRPWVLPHLHHHHHHQPPLPFQPSYINTLLLSLMQGVPSAADAQSSLLNTLLVGSNSFATTSNGSFPAAPGHVLQNNPRVPAAPPSSSVFAAPPTTLDPALLAAAETRLVLDCLKFNNAENQPSTSDHQLNQLLTRLLLIKLLQGSNSNNQAALAPSNPAACFENRAPIHNITAQRSGPLSADHLVQTPGLHQAATILLPQANNRETTTAPAPPSAYVNPNLCGSSSDNNHSSTPNTMLLNMFTSSYQQRLLQTLPFLGESVIEPCTSAAATDHLSSTSPHQLSHGSFPNCAAEHNGSMPGQQTPLWSGQGGGDNQMLPSGAQAVQLLAAAGLMQKQSLPGESQQVFTSGAQLLGGAGDVAVSKAPTLMTWEEHLMSEQKGGDRDLASSSTVSSSTLSSGSQSHAAPTTPTNNFNIQEYWSNLLNLISSTK